MVRARERGRLKEVGLQLVEDRIWHRGSGSPCPRVYLPHLGGVPFNVTDAE
jgi:hypothetical protein